MASALFQHQASSETAQRIACRRFHLLKPEYVHHRIKQLQRGYRLRIILCHVDVDDVVEPLSQVTADSTSAPCCE